VVLSVANVMSNRVLPRAWYVPWNVAVTLGMVTIAMAWDHRSARDLGFAEWASGLRWGSVSAGGVAVVYLVGIALPTTRDLFDDARAQRDLPRLAFDALVAVPLGTVLLEEVAFRGVLPAISEHRWGRRTAIGGSALLFGLWHVLPSWHLGDVNSGVRTAVDESARRAVTVGGAVAATAAVGVAFSWLRHRAGSLVAPMMLHTATNSLGYLLAWGLRRRRDSPRRGQVPPDRHAQPLP